MKRADQQVASGGEAVAFIDEGELYLPCAPHFCLRFACQALAHLNLHAYSRYDSPRTGRL